MLAKLLPAAVLGLLLGPPAFATEDCFAIGRAHERMLESSFEVERSLRMSVNGNLKRREVSRLAFSAGELETELIEEKVLSKAMTFDSEGHDFAVEAEFGCDRLEGIGDGKWELTSEDGLEVVTYVLDTGRDALRPVAWRMDTTEKFLFKKFVIEGRAKYQNFRWR